MILLQVQALPHLCNYGPARSPYVGEGGKKKGSPTSVELSGSLVIVKVVEIP